jgi:hypothetical protein
VTTENLLAASLLTAPFLLLAVVELYARVRAFILRWPDRAFYRAWNARVRIYNKKLATMTRHMHKRFAESVWGIKRY